MATAQKVGLTIRFKGIPETTPVPEDLKRVEIRFEAASGLTFVARVRNKAMNVLKKDVEALGTADWFCVANGDLGQALGPSVFLLENAGLKAIEIKPRPSSGASETPSPEP